MMSPTELYHFKRAQWLAKHNSIDTLHDFCKKKFDSAQYGCIFNLQIRAIYNNVKNKDLRRDYVPMYSVFTWQPRELLFVMQCDRLRLTAETKRTLIDMKQHIPSLKEALAMVIYKDFTSKFFRVIQKDNDDYDFEETETSDFLGKDINLNTMMSEELRRCKRLYTGCTRDFK